MAELDRNAAYAIRAKMQRWQNMTLVHQGIAVTIDGIGFSSLGRLELLAELTALARRVGVILKFSYPVSGIGQLDNFDLIIAADGVSLLARRSFVSQFGVKTTYLDDKFAWFGTSKSFDTLTQTFMETPFGPFNAHHY